PRVIAPLIVLGLLVWYLGAAVWLGQARQVYLVNGTAQPYTVAVNGREQRLPPGAPTTVQVREGEVLVEGRAGIQNVAPVRCRVETSFFTRPFTRPTFVINPDQEAILIREETTYSAKPGGAEPPGEVHLGQPFYTFTGIDYEFAPFPNSLEVQEGQTAKKSRVGLVPDLTSQVRLGLATQVLSRPQQLDYARHLLNLDPGDVVALEWLLGQLSDEEGLTLLRERLDVRPLLVEWHRAYQSLMDKAHPEEDLRPFYQKLVEDTGQQADAVY